ncbi:hypothetical protein [Candidatus Leptofilum sp.]|uniref:hypothetical protein n=1 Tax=Candidatus Leptofilum sp. TaxID=3241576 RepID=UPI003B59D55D
MYPEDRVLVAYVPHPKDFEIVKTDGWYRIPQKHAPKGLHAEYFAFYFGRRFGQEKWAIHYYAPQLGNELTTRLALFPDQPDHPRAQEMYYKVQLGPLQKLSQPIISLRWRRITFLHSTWDRFQDATEINDLFVDGEPYVDRLYATLKEQGIQAERNYTIREEGAEYVLPLVVLCKNGRIDLTQAQIQQNQGDPAKLAQKIADSVSAAGGPIL